MTPTLSPVQFHFDATEHVYTNAAGAKLCHITGMLEQTGMIDTTWFTEESCDRGIAVHDLTAAYDLGALDPRTLVSKFRGFLLAHVKAMQLLKPTHLAVEEPEVHPQWLFGGRPDRVSRIYNVLTVYEVKSGHPERSHQVQTALQAILVAWRYGLQPQMVQRMAGYYKNTGKFSLELHRDRADFDKAMRVIRECCK